MAEPVWGLLQKAQDDSETIEEAIARLIQDHLDNAAAHTAAGESLKVHKAATDIDHPVDSVIEENVLKRNITIDKLNWDKIVIETMFESLDAWTQAGGGRATAKIMGAWLDTTIAVDEYADIHAEVWDSGWGILCNKNPWFQTALRCSQITNQTIYFVAGGYDPGNHAYFGFKIVNGTLYAAHGKDANEYTTDISSGLTLTDYNVYRAVYTSATKIEFYVNDVLKATHTTNLPEDATAYPSEEVFRFRIQNSGANRRYLYFRYLRIIQDN